MSAVQICQVMAKIMHSDMFVLLTSSKGLLLGDDGLEMFLVWGICAHWVSSSIQILHP